MSNLKDEIVSSRRGFLKGALAAAATPLALSASAQAHDRPAPSERIGVGVVGLSSRGVNLLEAFLREPACQVVALCDVDRLHYRDSPWGVGPARGLETAGNTVAKYYADGQRPASRSAFQTGDFRELCARADVDAVVIATPDHWHARITIEALRAGKDVYCEKPVTHLFPEGQVVYREVAQRKAVFQAGSQQRSDARFRHAVEMVRNGHIGAVKRVEVGLPEGYNAPMGDTTITEPPDHLDYDFWCGPSEALPYMRARHHRWWRGHRAYGGGVLMDWIGHHNDIAHWGMGMERSGPRRVEAVGWEMAATDIYNTPYQYTVRCEYEGDITSEISSRHRTGCKWIGEDGWLFVNRETIEASNAEWTKRGFDPGPIKVYASDNHVGNFLDCVKSRNECIAPAEIAHRSVTPGHLGYVSHALGRALTWDPAEERFEDEAANTVLQAMHYRAPWSLET